MNWILRNKNKNVKTLVAVLFLVFTSLAFQIGSASAAPQNVRPCAGFNIEDTVEQKGIFSDGTTLCTCYPAINKCEGFKSNTKAECTALASQGSAGKPVYSYCTFQGNGNGGQSSSAPQGQVTVNPNNPKGLGDIWDNIFVKGIKFVLIGVLNVVGWLFSIAATLFTWVVDPANISAQGTGVLQKQAVKDVWIMVRDLLNMTFILILLFAAFCTIFQVEKWNLKKVWLNILINALLVNFSYPIARFFIDVSNVAFYYFINNLFSSSSGNVTSGGIFAMFGAASNIGAILKPENYANYEIAYLVTMIIMLFIMGMTLLIIAALFVVRLVALTMLVMFSPIGFVGYIFPATSSFADKWWKNLFSYSFFAPVMIFGMAIALKVTEAIGKENMQSFKAAASAQAPADQTSFISNAAFMVIPIVILWATIGVAKSMGIEGADKVVDYAKKGGKSLAMKMSGGNWAKKNYDAFSASRKKRAEEIGKKRLGNNLGDRLNNRQDKIIAGVMGKDSAAAKRYDKRKMEKNKDDIKDDAEKGEGIDMTQLKSNLNAGLTNPSALNDKQKHDFAVHSKIALARGAKYETEMDNEFKAAMNAAPPGDANYGAFEASKAAHAAAETAHTNKNSQLSAVMSAGPGTTVASKADYQVKLATMNAEIAILKDAKEKARKDKETEEKKALHAVKTARLDALRKAVQVGEDVGRIKPR